MDSSATALARRALTCLLLGSSLTLAACPPVVVITPYDEVTETKLQDFREGLNVLVKRAASGKGTAAGTFDASKDAYLVLEAQIEGLVSRAKSQDQGIGCKLDNQTWDRIKKQLAKAAGLPAANSTTGDEYGCITLLLSNVQQNLTSLESIHKDPAQCVSKVPEFPTCLRQDAAQDALDISNQTIDAALFVESALKKHGESK